MGLDNRGKKKTMQEPIEDSSCAEDDEIVVKPTKTPVSVKSFKRAYSTESNQKSNRARCTSKTQDC